MTSTSLSLSNNGILHILLISEESIAKDRVTLHTVCMCCYATTCLAAGPPQVERCYPPHSAVICRNGCYINGCYITGKSSAILANDARYYSDVIGGTWRLGSPETLLHRPQKSLWTLAPARHPLQISHWKTDNSRTKHPRLLKFCMILYHMVL